MIANLTLALTALGRLDEAQSLLDGAFALKYDSYAHHNNAYHLAFLRGDEAAMKHHYDAVVGRESDEEFLLQAASNTEAFHGRYDSARELSARAAALALRDGSLEMARHGSRSRRCAIPMRASTARASGRKPRQAAAQVETSCPRRVCLRACRSGR